LPIATPFENHSIRRAYDEDTEIWWFSVVDIVQVLTDQADYQTARKYWNKLKERLSKEGSQSVTNCHRLKTKQRITTLPYSSALLLIIMASLTGNHCKLIKH
jgi:prophage antirepressor-like protein